MEDFRLPATCNLGHELLDAQHEVILAYMAKVYTYLLSNKMETELFGVIDRLDTFCKLHFLEEEQVMETIGCSDMESHKVEHALFFTHLEHFIGTSEERDSSRSIVELLFLKSWFLKHVEVFDKTYARQWNG